MFTRQALRCARAQPLKQVCIGLEAFPSHYSHVTQSFRKYSTEAPKSTPTPEPPAPKKSNLTPIYVGVGLAGAAAGYYRYTSGGAVEAKDRPKAFNGQDWVDLKVSQIENLSHNTKRVRFEFEDKEAVGGLPVACKHRFFQSPVVMHTNVMSSCSADPIQA